MLRSIKNAQDEDLVDDTLEDVPVGTDNDMSLIDIPPATIDFDDNDGYDDGYDSDGDAGIANLENSGLF